MVKAKTLSFLLGSSDNSEELLNFIYHLQNPDIEEIFIYQNPYYIFNFFVALFVTLETQPIRIILKALSIILKCINLKQYKNSFVNFFKSLINSIYSYLPKDPQYTETTYSQYVKNRDIEEKNYRERIIRGLMATKALETLFFTIKEISTYSGKTLLI